jgi:hypothetical protein
MEFELKTLSPDAVPRALEKAVRYRLLNEPGEAASICLDVLAADADNQEAIATLILALTDQFEGEDSVAALAEAWETLARVQDEYGHSYYAGIIWERRARARLRRGMPDAGARGYEWLCEAMACYVRAEAIRPAGNDDAVLRWNACARLINRDRRLVPAEEERGEPLLLE